jgi:hypothetical protein
MAFRPASGMTHVRQDSPPLRKWRRFLLRYGASIPPPSIMRLASSRASSSL